MMMPPYLFWDYDGAEYDDEGEYGTGGHDEIIEEESDEECLITKDDLKRFKKKLRSHYLLPEEKKSQSPGNKIDKAKGKGDSLNMPVPYKADEENLNYPLKSQECLITSKDLKYQKKIRDFHIMIELKVFSLNRRLGEKFRSLVAVCKDDLERKMNVDGEYQKKIRDFDIMMDNEFFDLKGRLRKKFQSLVAICKDNNSQSQECLITSKDDLERKRNVDGEHEKKIRDFDIMIESELFCLKRRLIKKFGSFVAVCNDNKSQSQECLITSQDDLKRKRNVDGEYQKKIRDFDITIEKEFFRLKERLKKKFRSLVAVCKDNKSQSQECLITSQDDLKRKRNVDGEYQKKINGRKRRPIEEEIDEDYVFQFPFTCEDRQ